METFKSYAIAHGYYNSLKRYMYDDEHLSEWGELVVVKNADAKLIEAYIKRHSLKPYSHLELFNFSQTLGLQLIETGCLLADEAFEYPRTNKGGSARSSIHIPMHCSLCEGQEKKKKA